MKDSNDVDIKNARKPGAKNVNDANKVNKARKFEFPDVNWCKENQKIIVFG
jgi:hypothetical protein